MSILRRNAKGQMMVLYAIAMVAIVGALALCTDVALMYLDWQHSQKVADAAAQAGANFLTGLTYTGAVDPSCSGQPDTASKAACTYAVDNGLPVADLTISDTATTVKVVAKQAKLPYLLGSIVGASTYDVSATAAAQAASPVNQVNSGLFPIGLQCPSPCPTGSLVAGEPLSFGAKFVGGLANGNWQWLDVSGNGASGVGTAISNGQGGSYHVGGTIPTKPGNIGNAGPVKNAFKDRMKSCDSYASDPCSGANPKDLLKPGDPCTVIMPVVDFTGCGGKCDLNIEGFAEVYIEPATSTSTTINGCFVSSVVGSTIGGGGGTPSFGPLSPPVLTQ